MCLTRGGLLVVQNHSDFFNDNHHHKSIYRKLGWTAMVQCDLANAQKLHSRLHSKALITQMKLQGHLGEMQYRELRKEIISHNCRN